MRKYPVSKFYIGVLGSGLALLILSEAISIWAVEESVRMEPSYYIVQAIFIIGIFSTLYIIFFDLPTAKFSFSDEGITMYVGFKKYETRWSEFAYAGIVAVNVEAVKSIYTSDTFWVYFSKSFLTDREKMRFLSKTRKDLKRIAYFQYSKPMFDQVLEQVPEELRKQLLWDEEHIIGQMNFWEKVYNK